MSYDDFKKRISKMAKGSTVTFEYDSVAGIFTAVFSNGTVIIGRENELKLSVKFGKRG